MKYLRSLLHVRASFIGVKTYLFQPKQTIPFPHLQPPLLLLLQLKVQQLILRLQRVQSICSGLHFNYVRSEGNFVPLLYRIHSLHSSLTSGALALIAHLFITTVLSCLLHGTCCCRVRVCEGSQPGEKGASCPESGFLEISILFMNQNHNVLLQKIKIQIKSQNIF